jgi:hypothetical protein
MTTLTYNGTEKSLAGWGIALSSARRSLNQQASDTYSFSIPVTSVTTAMVFDFDEQIVIRRGRKLTGGAWSDEAGARCVFVGYISSQVVDGAGDSVRQNYEATNLWRWLESTPYQQPVSCYANAKVQKYQTGILLFTKLSEGSAVDPRESTTTAGVLIYITNGWQIELVLKHALKAWQDQGYGTLFTIGTIDPDIYFPSFYVQEISCAAAIIKCLEDEPSASVWWDYNTSPPTIHVRRRAGLTPVNMALADGVSSKSLMVRPRYDLQVSSVIIYYVTTGTVDGVVWKYVTPDMWGTNDGGATNGANLGPTAGYGVLIQTIDLEGSQVTHVRSTIDVQPLVRGPRRELSETSGTGGVPTNLQQLAWWISTRGGGKTEFADQSRVTWADIQFGEWTCKDEAGADIDISVYKNRLVTGTVMPWMKTTGNSAILTKRAIISVWTKYTEWGWISVLGVPAIYAPSSQYAEKQITCSVTLTNGESGEYSTVDTFLAGEAIPVGVAHTLYDQFAPLQWEGNNAVVSADAGEPVHLGNLLNLTNGQTAWASMNAMVRTVEDAEGSGDVTVGFGPPRHLGARELCDLQLNNRQRRVWKNPLTIETGQAGDSGGDLNL